jgi:hypothetical protein
MPLVADNAGNAPDPAKLLRFRRGQPGNPDDAIWESVGRQLGIRMSRRAPSRLGRTGALLPALRRYSLCNGIHTARCLRS